jgi:hypothetical protein
MSLSRSAHSRCSHYRLLAHWLVVVADFVNATAGASADSAPASTRVVATVAWPPSNIKLSLNTDNKDLLNTEPEIHRFGSEQKHTTFACGPLDAIRISAVYL